MSINLMEEKTFLISIFTYGFCSWRSRILKQNIL